MNEMQIFSSEEFGNIRTVTIDNEPMFCLADVCRILEIKNVSDCKSRLMTKGIATTDTLTNGGTQKMTFISEANLYKTIFQSRKESAERFTDWVTSEVLPTLRKTGQFNMQNMSTEMKALLMHDEKIVKIEREIDDLKNNVPLFTSEATELSRHVRRRGTELLGGKDSAAYKNKVMRRGVFIDIYQQLKREFNIFDGEGRPLSYTAMKRKYIEAAHDFLERYKPSYVQQEMIEEYNSRKGI